MYQLKKNLLLCFSLNREQFNQQHKESFEFRLERFVGSTDSLLTYAVGIRLTNNWILVRIIDLFIKHQRVGFVYINKFIKIRALIFVLNKVPIQKFVNFFNASCLWFRLLCGKRIVVVEWIRRPVHTSRATIPVFKSRRPATNFFN